MVLFKKLYIKSWKNKHWRCFCIVIIYPFSCIYSNLHSFLLFVPSRCKWHLLLSFICNFISCRCFLVRYGTGCEGFTPSILLSDENRYGRRTSVCGFKSSRPIILHSFITRLRALPISLIPSIGYPHVSTIDNAWRGNESRTQRGGLRSDFIILQ